MGRTDLDQSRTEINGHPIIVEPDRILHFIIRAALLLHPSFFHFALELPKTEEEARAIFAAYRTKARGDE